MRIMLEEASGPYQDRVRCLGDPWAECAWCENCRRLRRRTFPPAAAAAGETAGCRTGLPKPSSSPLYFHSFWLIYLKIDKTYLLRRGTSFPAQALGARPAQTFILRWYLSAEGSLKPASQRWQRKGRILSWTATMWRNRLVDLKNCLEHWLHLCSFSLSCTSRTCRFSLNR